MLGDKDPMARTVGPKARTVQNEAVYNLDSPSRLLDRPNRNRNDKSSIRLGVGFESFKRNSLINKD